MTPDALLRLFADRETRSAADLRHMLGVTSPELSELVRATDGLVVPVELTTYARNYRLSDEGRTAAADLVQSTAADRLVVRLRSDDGRAEALVTTLLSHDGTPLAAQRMPADSYRLASIRYQISRNPTGVTADDVMSVSTEIGSRLLPACRDCRLRVGRGQKVRVRCPERACVRAAFEEVLEGAAARGPDAWLALDLDVGWPWVNVPWELAAWRLGDYAALRAGLALRRIAPGGAGTDYRPPSTVPVLIAVPSCTPGSPDDSEFRAEAESLRTELESSAYAVTVADPFASVDELARAVATARPRVVQLIGHGSVSGLEVADAVVQKADVVAAVAQEGVEVVLLGSCYGATETGCDLNGSSLARMLAEHGVARVVAFEGRAEAGHARAFASGFYRDLARTRCVEQAVRAGRRAMTDLGTAFVLWGQVVLFTA